MDIALSILTILSVLTAIVALIHAMVIHRKTQRETNESLIFLTKLIINSAPDPKVVKRLLDDYNRSGEWRANVVKDEDGKYHINFDITSSVAIGVKT